IVCVSFGASVCGNEVRASPRADRQRGAGLGLKSGATGAGGRAPLASGRGGPDKKGYFLPDESAFRGGMGGGGGGSPRRAAASACTRARYSSWGWCFAT